MQSSKARPITTLHVRRIGCGIVSPVHAHRRGSDIVHALGTTVGGISWSAVLRLEEFQLLAPGPAVRHLGVALLTFAWQAKDWKEQHPGAHLQVFVLQSLGTLREP